MALDAVPTMPDQPPQRYTILGSIHRGGMGEILLAKVGGPEGFSRKVVLKGLLSKLSQDDISYQLFMREARLMACLDHPNIVRVFDLPYVRGKPYLAMEYLRGRNFHQVIQRAAAFQGGVPTRLALHVVAEAARGLHYAHSVKNDENQPLGIIHRDVSPGNLLASFFGEVKVTDFGIAKIAGAPRFTSPRSIRGKARYVAPEQVHGAQATVLSDIYSSGVVLAEALLGEPLWERSSVPETLLAIVSEDREKTIDRVLEKQPNIPGMRSALRGALALNPKNRFVSALQFAETLESIARSIGTPATHVELGLYLRELFRDAPDLPVDDGFGKSGIPPPVFEVDDQDTDPTIIALEPEWIKQSNKKAPTTRMRPSDPCDIGPPTPQLTPVIESFDVDIDSEDLRPKRLPPPPPAPSRIRATPLPANQAIFDPAEHASYPFSELIPVPPTDEEESRELTPPMALQPLRRRTTYEKATPNNMGLLLAGIFIGASLAIGGCLIALLLG